MTCEKTLYTIDDMLFFVGNSAPNEVFLRYNQVVCNSSSFTGTAPDGKDQYDYN